MKPDITVPYINRLNLQLEYGGYEIPEFYNSIPLTPYVPLDISGPSLKTYSGGNPDIMDYDAWMNVKAPNTRKESNLLRTRSSLIDPTGRFPHYHPDYDNEDAYAQNQGWTTKAFNGLTKGLALTGTTFLQTTVGLVNGLYQAYNDDRWASFYDNEFNRALDDFNKKLETILPSYETKQFRDAKWYSPDYLLTGNFVWEGVVKNLGFAAGAALSGLALSGGLAWAGRLAKMSRLTAAGRVADVMTDVGMITKGTQQANQIKSWSDNLLASYKSLSFGERALVSAFATTGEAGIEAYHNLNDYRENAIKTFEEEFGRTPTNEELAQINKAADSIGNASMVGNVVLLSATNFIQFPKILGSSYKAEKGVLNELAKKTKSIALEGGEYVAKKSKYPFLSTINKVRPYTFSISEAFEEGSQFAIGKATEDYYEKKYKPKDKDLEPNWLDSILEGYKQTLNTDEGMKNVLIGGLSGALMLGRGKYRESNRARKNTEEALRSGKWQETGLNSAKLSDFMSDTYDSVSRGAEIQGEREGYTEAGDIVNSKDAEADYIINYLSPRIKHGRYDLVLADIRDYQNLAASDTGWAELIEKGIVQPNDTKEAFTARLEQFAQTAENVKSLYQSLNLRYKGIVNNQGERVYPDEVIDKMVYAASKIADYNNRYSQLSSELIGINIDEIATAVINKDDKPLNDVSKIISERDDLTETQKEEIVQKIVDASKIALRRNHFYKEYKALVESPEKFIEKTAIEIPETTTGEEITIKSGKTEKVVTTGKPYYLIDKFKPSVNGIPQARSAQKIEIIKQNEDGSVEVKFPNGNVKQLSPKEIANYDLRSVEDTEKNPGAMLVLENLDEKYVHYGLNQYGKRRKKDEEPAEGVLEYDEKDNTVYFTWETPKGKIYRSEAPSSHFRAKEGSNYKGGMIRKLNQSMTEAQRIAEEAWLRSQPSLSERLEKRISVANNLYENLRKEISTIANKIAANNSRLASLDQEIENAYKTKSGKPRKRITKTLINTVDELEKLKKTIPEENERLQDQQIMLEAELVSVEDFIENITELAPENDRMLGDIKEEMSNLKDLISLTKDAIKQTERQLPLIEALYKKALELLNSFMKGLAKANPGIPLSLDAYEENMSRRIGDEAAAGIIERGEGFTEQVLDLENTILSYSEDIKFPQMEQKFLNMSRDLKELENALTEMEANYRAKEKILVTFKNYYAQEAKKQKSEQKLKGDAKNQQAADASLDKDGASISIPPSYDIASDPDYFPTARKATTIAPTASIPIDDGKPWQKRANEFGFNLPKFQEEGKDIKGIYVTAQNQEDVGMDGLIETLMEGAPEKYKIEEGIVTVMVVEQNGKLIPVDVNGDPITDSANYIEQGIYQWMPMGNLSNTFGSMFREGTSKEVVDEVVARYKKWRSEILPETEVKYTYTPKASFGRLEWQEAQETSVVDAKFIEDEKVLGKKSVINISTTQKELVGGTTSYPNPYKRVLIKVGEEYAQLQNKTHSEEEAITIFRMIKALAEEFTNNPNKLKSDKAQRILESLKGRVYWGLPTDKEGKMKKDTPYSGIYFSYEFGLNEFPTLFIGRDTRIPFTPTALERDFSKAKEALMGLYSNTNYKYLKSSKKEGSALTRSYEEIVEMSEDGRIIKTRLWPNYQTYLLSSKNPDGSERTRIPLTTVANPVTESNPVNRTGIYFYNPEMGKNYTVKEKRKVNLKAEQKKSVTVSDKKLINFIENLGPEFRAAIEEMDTFEKKVEKAGILFEQIAITEIAKQGDEVKAIKDPAKKQAAIDEQVQLYNKTPKTIPINERVQELWRVYQTITTPPKTKPQPKEWEMTFSEEDVNEVPDGPNFAQWTLEFDEADVQDAPDVPSEIISVDTSPLPDSTPPEAEPPLFGRVPDKEDSEDVKEKPEQIRKKKRPGGRKRYRKYVGSSIEGTEDWVKVEQWLKKNFPNLPIYRLKEIIKNVNGDPYAYGMFADGAIYVWNAAEVGTVYHEVFEAVWKMFTPANEQANIISEFKSRAGSFVDRETKNKVKFSEATDYQIKEQLAEEFRAYINKKSIPPKGVKGWILKLFQDLKKLISDLFINPKSDINNLFDKIDTGYYAKNMPYARVLSYASKGIIDIEEVSEIPEDAEFMTLSKKLTDAQRNDAVEELIYVTATKLLNSSKGLFSLDPVDVNDEYLKKALKTAIQLERENVVKYSERYVDDEGVIQPPYYSKEERDAQLVELFNLEKNMMREFADIKQLYISRIQRFDIQIDENDKAQSRSEEKTRNSDYVEATKVDKFKKMNPALKLLFNTVAIVDEYDNEEVSSIGGVKTLPFSSVKNTLMKSLENSRDVNDMQERFRNLAKRDPNFRRLYRRFYNASYLEENIKFDNIKSIQDIRLVSGLWKTFSLFAPKVKNIFILENGDVEVGDANLSSEALQYRAEMMNDIIIKSKSGGGLFKYSVKGELFQVDREKLAKYKSINTALKAVEFLQDLGVSFPGRLINDLGRNKQDFYEAVNGIRDSIAELNTIKTFSSKTLDIHGRLLEIALFKAKATSEEFDSTFFNIVGERTQTYIGGNTPQRLFRALSQIDNLRELEGTEFEYLIRKNDVFTEHSNIIKRMFDEDGNKRDTAHDEEHLLTVGYAGGTSNDIKGRRRQSSKLSLRDRFLQEISLNLKGWYMNLVPGDASTEWMTYLGNFVTKTMLRRADLNDKNERMLAEEVHDIFKGYFIDEVNLAREGRLVHKSRDNSSLRFFDDLLPEATKVKIKQSTEDAETLYDKTVRKAVEERINLNKKLVFTYLMKLEAIKQEDEDTNNFSIENTPIKNITIEELDLELTALTINYMMANIEQHKLIYGDPFQYKDELKRTKSFQSPRQEILNSSQDINETLHRIWNKKYPEGSLGHTDFLRDFFRTTTYDDVRVADELHPLLGIMEETDGGGIISLKGYRNFKIRSSDWTEANEKQFDYDILWETTHKDLLKKVKDGSITQEEMDRRIKKLDRKNPKIKDTYTTLKPIVTGNSLTDVTYNTTVLDKYSLYPLSYRVMVQMGATNAVKLYNKMSEEDIDYVIFNSGRKVGAYKTVSPYKESGEFNSDTYPTDTIINIPFSIIGLQTEVPSKDQNDTVRGSQVTKLITMDRMNAGVPIDWRPDEPLSGAKIEAWNNLTGKEKQKQSPLYREIVNNRKLLRDMIQFGYESLLTKLGIEEKNDTFIIPDYEKTVSLIRNEVLKREANDNIIKALDSFMTSTSVLEATPAYRQISNILYSIVDKNIVHPKISGGMKVQIPSTFFEDKRNKVRNINGKPALVSDALKFYSIEKDGKTVNVMEIMAGRWFKSNMTDEELLDYLNNDPEGQKILEGFAFRIPTQNMNSIDAFRIKKFLPEEFGDNVVVPSALVGKVGSDFDIDKLSMYLKNVISRGYEYNGKPQLVKYYPLTEEGRKQALWDAELYLEKEWRVTKKQLEKETNKASFMADLALGKRMDPKEAWKWLNIYKEWFGEELVFSALPEVVKKDGVIETDEDGRVKGEIIKGLDYRSMENFFMEKIDKLNKTLDKLDTIEVFNITAQKMADKLMKQGLENAYIESNIKLLTFPSNYKKLTSPNSAKLMKDLSEEINSKKGIEKTNYSDPGKFLNRIFMTELRHNFVAGKQGIGRAAVGQTNHANNQQQLITVDLDKISQAPENEKRWLQVNSGKINFKNYNSIFDGKKKIPTLSMIYNQAGQYISDILGMFIDGYVDISNDAWIMEMGATPQTTSTWQFLIKLGVPLEDVAWFMNQPIITDYLQMLENKGYSYLFIDSYVNELKENKYASKADKVVKSIPSSIVLKRTVGKKTLTESEKLQQQFYLDEFLKYAMMSQHLFYFTQATNHDTATFNNPYLLFKKEKQLERAKKSIISSPDDMLRVSWIGHLREILIDKVRPAISKVLISDRKNINSVIEKVLEPYIDMNDKDFVIMAQRAIANLFDYAMQTHTGINNDIEEILIGDRNIARQAYQFLKAAKSDPELAENYVVRMMEIVPSKSSQSGGTDNIRIKAQNSEVYDQNRMIYAFRELREVLGEKSELYQGLIKLAILQSGLSASALSYTNLIPFEDFVDYYNEAIQLIDTRVDLDVFDKLHVFQRNNWNISDVVPYIPARYMGKGGYNPGMRKLSDGVKEAIAKNEIPQITKLIVGRDTQTSHIVHTWELSNDELLTKEQKATLKDRAAINEKAKEIRKQMKDAGDFSFKRKALMQRVTYPDGTPYIEKTINWKGDEISYYLYKAINAWGNGPRANEFYDVAVSSEINNGFEKVKESGDERIIEIYEKYKDDNVKRINTFSLPLKTNQVVLNYSVPILKSNPNHIFVFGDNTERKGKGGQAVIRDEKNAFGIATKLKPNNNADAFMTDVMLETNKQVIDEDIAKIKRDGRPVVFPAKGLGTGRADLKNKAPKTYEYLKQRLLEEFEYDNDAGQFTYDKRKDDSKKSSREHTMSLKGKTYKFSEINEELLVSLGYSQESERNRILKIVCS